MRNFNIIAARRVCVAVTLLMSALVVGCSSAENERGAISGIVVLDGTPLESGTIALALVDSDYPIASAEIVAGKYELEAPLEAYKVVISSPQVVKEVSVYNQPGGPTRAITEETLPDKYNTKSELRIDVTPGKMERNFDLSSK